MSDRVPSSGWTMLSPAGAVLADVSRPTPPFLPCSVFLASASARGRFPRLPCSADPAWANADLTRAR